MALYLNCVYFDDGESSWFRERWLSTGRKLDMGKSCVRFRALGDVPLEVVGEAIARVPVTTTSPPTSTPGRDRRPIPESTRAVCLTPGAE